MKKAFVDHFYSIQRCISLRELSDIEQDKNDLAYDFINRWHALNLHCFQEMMQEEAVKLCMSVLHPWI